MPDNPRIEELRRRVQKDPASIAFAQLAEEHRRAGDYDEAVRVSRAGLAQHPGYLSARVTLGRALVEAGEYDEAQRELDEVLRAAPDNLAAIRALAEIHQRREEPGTPLPLPPPLPGSALSEPVADFSFAGSDEQFAQALQTLDAMPRDLPIREPDFGMAESGWPDAALSPLDSAAHAPAPEPALPDPPAPQPPDGSAPISDSDSRVLGELETWLDAIAAERQARGPLTPGHS